VPVHNTARTVLGAGDAQGNIRIYSLATLTLLTLKVAHDGEVLCLDYGAGRLAVQRSCALTARQVS